mmetsp:Transcript_30810/g.68248  ORF Transcript_30810/g.68248 Transcript_30810/m.68248 type:complete len:332 (-) Transcript_30810:1567-2562(-)|eukprot:CAMPEP_0202901532 /NCGR_PEP_ID=MMETSP1392-20130828/14303_1 /ASSEMBLY_ACC=CAM_ASM_000868 /TAXON_ID=225041 /ORGANISM="Chlamydomonas chlamydogama, Strain SAG 11-48b" /LENGTH=331 /DNA_ID=CAMNT_0049588105 /DNA_START=299 /DNA_END=1294 /DNA_ORIENTATION=-
MDLAKLLLRRGGGGAIPAGRTDSIDYNKKRLAKQHKEKLEKEHEDDADSGTAAERHAEGEAAGTSTTRNASASGDAAASSDGHVRGGPEGGDIAQPEAQTKETGNDSDLESATSQDLEANPPRADSIVLAKMRIQKQHAPSKLAQNASSQSGLGSTEEAEEGVRFGRNSAEGSGEDDQDKDKDKRRPRSAAIVDYFKKKFGLGSDHHNQPSSNHSSPQTVQQAVKHRYNPPPPGYKPPSAMHHRSSCDTSEGQSPSGIAALHRVSAPMSIDQVQEHMHALSAPEPDDSHAPATQLQPAVEVSAGVQPAPKRLPPGLATKSSPHHAQREGCT